jgi:hypothetical protein
VPLDWQTLLLQAGPVQQVYSFNLTAYNFRSSFEAVGSA